MMKQSKVDHGQQIIVIDKADSETTLLDWWALGVLPIILAVIPIIIRWRNKNGK